MLAPSKPVAEAHAHNEPHYGHSHGLVDRSIVRSRAGIRAVSRSLVILTLTALAQAFIYSRTVSVALLADLIHNFGDALTAIPLGIAFFLRSARGGLGWPSCSPSSSAPWLRSAKPSSASFIRTLCHIFGSWQRLA
jgi:hypothetical protein